MVPGSLSGILLCRVLQFSINETHPFKAETICSHLQTKLKEGFEIKIEIIRRLRHRSQNNTFFFQAIKVSNKMLGY